MTLYQYPKRWLISLPPEFDEEEPVELFYDTPEEAIHYCVRFGPQFFLDTGFYAGTAEISDLPFLVIFRNLDNSIRNTLSQSLHPFRKTKISRILLADVVHLHL